ncbi:MAG: hypothetical protein JNL01_16400 [Bdellovibrionales bacterium]|nr:hypothetical protein [Bdellovibrionales bacterium]
MRFDELFVIHLPALSAAPQAVPATDSAASAHEALRGFFHLKTCQRQIWVGSSAELSDPILASPGLEFRTGDEAYKFLLQVSTGLASQIKGETDIFGQLKDAWKEFQTTGSGLTMGLDMAHELGPWMQRLFEDTKDIRARFLQNIGSDGYGSLIRKLLKRTAPRGPEEPILLVGAGKIAQSIAPWLLPNEIWIWNRTPANRAALAFELRQKGAEKIRELPETLTALHDALLKTSHVIFCVPPTSDAAELALTWRKGCEGAAFPRMLIHLGGSRADLPAFAEILRDNVNAFTLDDLFKFQKEQNAFRESLFVQAERACEERARLRGIPGSAGGSATLPHGWEDLALFA